MQGATASEATVQFQTPPPCQPLQGQTPIPI
jgi:hypothetical protein